jgi:hypothetical protein
MRHLWKPALAAGALLAVSGLANAGDTQLLAGGPAGSTTMTLGGKGTISQAATEDNELTHGYRGYYGWHGGYGYRGYYGGYRGYYRPYVGHYGYRGYYGGYYRPAYYYRPYYYSNYYYRPYYYPSYYYGYSPGIYIGISGDASTTAPAVNLGNTFTPPMTQPTPPSDGTFQYDGGPSNPVPLPKAEPQQTPPTGATTIPISGKPGISPATTPYKYKAYGEK